MAVNSSGSASVSMKRRFSRSLQSSSHIRNWKYALLWMRKETKSKQDGRGSKIRIESFRKSSGICQISWKIQQSRQDRPLKRLGLSMIQGSLNRRLLRKSRNQYSLFTPVLTKICSNQSRSNPWQAHNNISKRHAIESTLYVYIRT